MNSSSSGKSPEKFLTGKGFYIVLFLCAAVIGVSAWVMATGNEAMKKAERLTFRCGPSSSARNASFLGLPMVKVPAGMAFMDILTAVPGTVSSKSWKAVSVAALANRVVSFMVMVPSTLPW